jgi:hypothetical protein
MAQAKTQAIFTKLYGELLSTDKLFDEKTAYVCHVKTEKLHGVFFNEQAMNKLRSAVENFLELSDEFSKMLEKSNGPVTYEMASKYLRNWVKTSSLSRDDITCEHTTDEEKNAMQHMVMIGGCFLPADKSYWIGWSLLQALNIIDGFFGMISKMLKGLPADPTEWKNVKAPFPKYAEKMTAGLKDLTTAVAGYGPYVKKTHTTIAKLLDDKISTTETSIIGDCNREFYMALRENKRACHTICSC